ncbi:AbiH family protein [Mucilaginibacter calamicampi]|uniref:AbiH family protein n=1 Tax=Mucilaginibacter calamicampi TaxID=1302352 RepID=A0ABW2Z3K4_9SPHI
MNRLILIGNGFDLAHGLRTGYNDFILWYLNKILIQSGGENGYADALIKVRLNPNVNLYLLPRFSIEDELRELYEDDCLYKLLNNEAFRTGHSEFSNIFNVYEKSPLLVALLQSCRVNNWVDIENEYYKQLAFIQTSDSSEGKSSKLKALNESMSCLIARLQEYLVSLPQPSIIDSYESIFTSKILTRDVHMPREPESGLFNDELPTSTLVVNFNYTPTIDLYSHLQVASQETKMEVTHIHGTIKSLDSMIFGFGDELDERYSLFEKETDNGYYKFFKSFWYLKTSQYRDLTRFADYDPFQIYIIGHSCGLSDRTMLNMLFEHKHCMSVKIFYHKREDGSTNFTELTYNIARHFKDKGRMRMRVVDFESSEEMPQTNRPDKPIKD